MIEYKAVAMDLDDTLLTSDLQISEETKQTLLQCQKDGMHVILASGRPIYAIEKYAKELELEKYGGYIVGFNGAAVRDCKAKRMIMQRNLPIHYRVGSSEAATGNLSNLCVTGSSGTKKKCCKYLF